VKGYPMQIAISVSVIPPHIMKKARTSKFTQVFSWPS